jgi:hypothetical protein
MKLTFEGDALHDIIPQMLLMLTELGYPLQGSAPQRFDEETELPLAPPPEEAPAEETTKRKPGRPKKTASVPDEEPTPAPAPAPDEEPAQTVEEKHPLDFDAIRSTAITKLMTVYNMGGAHSVKVKGILKEFGVTKFAEVPEERLKELLSRAVELESEAA